MQSPTQPSITYSAAVKMLDLAYDVSLLRSLESPIAKKKISQGVKIDHWLNALQYSNVIPFDVRQKLVTCLAQIAGVYRYPVAPTLANIEPPIITGNGGGGNTIINNYFYSFGTVFQNSAVTGTEVVDTFPVISAKGASWLYTVTNGTNQRTGQIVGTWLSDGSQHKITDYATADIGDTDDVEFELTFSGGNIQLRCITPSGSWAVIGTRIFSGAV